MAVYESSHPLVKHLVNSIRDISIDAAQFRSRIAQIAQLLLYEALTEWKLAPKKIETWIGEKEFGFIDQKEIVFIPILRAGLPMMEGVSELLSEASVGFLAMKRDEQTFKPHIFYERFPEIADKTVILLDPMLATGGSLADAISVVKTKNPARILSLNIVAAPEGVEYVQRLHPDVDVHIAQIDSHLNERKYIIPGLGDAGDRAYNT